MPTYRELALHQARRYIGTKEKPPYSNRGVFIDIWNEQAAGMVGVYWCASFVHAMYRKAGFDLPGGASVGNILGWARKMGYTVKRPRRGDLVCFEFGSDRAFDDHIGFVERVLALRWGGGTFTGWIQTVEGNTSSGNYGSQDDGGGVFRRRRWVRGIGAKFVRVPGSSRP
jgi:hypothetical protein